jgi:hypothetical protein
MYSGFQTKYQDEPVAFGKDKLSYYPSRGY